MIIEPNYWLRQYGFQNYKINVDLEDTKACAIKTKPQSTDLTQDKGKLNVASYNLENSLTINTYY